MRRQRLVARRAHTRVGCRAASAERTRGTELTGSTPFRSQAVLFHSLLIPSCALLAPVVLMRTVVVPRLLHKAPTALWPASAALVFGGVCLLTPAAAALVPPTIAVPAASLEPELARSARERGLTAVFSSRFLY